MAQLPPDAYAAAFAILVYSIVCLLCNLLMLWLLWTSRQVFSHVGIISIFLLVCISVDIAQQTYDTVYWVDMQTARFNHIKANVGNPLLSASGGAYGVDFVFWAIRYGCESVAAGQACFWALSLTQAVYGWANKWADWILMNNAGKVISIVLPAICLSLIHLEAVQNVPPLFYFLLDVPYFGFIAGGAFGLLMILIKYIKTRRELKSWEVTTRVNGHTTWRSYRLEDDAPADGTMPAQHAGIYDNWLLARFSVADSFICSQQYAAQE